MMKKSFAILLAVSMLFTLAACGNNALEKETQSSTENSSPLA